MKMMNSSTSLPLVTFEQSQRLKMAGFDWLTELYYWKEERELGSDTFHGFQNWNSTNYRHTTSAPTVALALKWMRDEKGFAFYVRCEHEWETNSERVYFDPVSWYGEYENSGAISNTDTVNTYESAESALLDELLTLIDK